METKQQVSEMRKAASGAQPVGHRGVVRAVAYWVMLGSLMQQPAFALTAGAGLITTIVAWLSGLGLGVATIAILWSGFKVMFQGARFQDVSNVLIGSVLIGSAAVIAGVMVTT